MDTASPEGRTMNETTTKDSKTRRWLGRAHLQVRRHGWSAALHDLAIRALNSVSVFKILRGVVIERPDPAYLSCPDGYAAGFLTAPAVRALARLPELEMADEFVEEALAKG